MPKDALEIGQGRLLQLFGGVPFVIEDDLEGAEDGVEVLEVIADGSDMSWCILDCGGG